MPELMKNKYYNHNSLYELASRIEAVYTDASIPNPFE